MTRRDLFTLASAAAAPGYARHPLDIPVQVMFDGNIKWRPEHANQFKFGIWAQAVREFSWCDIRFRITEGSGEVGRPPNREPFISGLRRESLNIVVTDTLPLEWDQGRALSGITTLFRGFHVCMIAWAHAHGNRIPFFSLNTCVHEMLHAFMLDIFENRPKGASGSARESRIDWYATRLWLLRDGGAIHDSAGKYLRRLVG